MQKLLRVLAAAGVLGVVAIPAAAQYPSRPIHIVVPFSAGGAVDTVARILASPLSQSLGQPVVVENKPGADGAIAVASVAKSAPDGYTIVFGGSSAMLGVSATRKNPPYDVIADLVPISSVGEITFFLVVHPSVPAKTLSELIDYARANPGRLNYPSTNLVTTLAFAQLKSLANVDIVQVPYKGVDQANLDLLSGRVHVTFTAGNFAVPLVKEGRLRVLATLLPKRSSMLPSVPTIAEAGMPRLTMVPWTAMFAPAKTPKEIVERVSHEVNVLLKRPDIRAQIEKQGVEPGGSTPAELGAYLKRQLIDWGEAARAAGLKPE